MGTHERQKVIVVIGTRPEAIKLAPVVLELDRHRAHFDTKICVTGQHREMLDQMLRVFGLRPDYDLEIMKAGQGLAGVTAACVTGLDRILRQEHSDLVLVQGDTTTTLAAALAAYYHHIPVGHIEACAQARRMIRFPKRSTAASRPTFPISISLPPTSRETICSRRGSARRAYR